MDKRLQKKSLNVLVDAVLLAEAKKSGIRFSELMDTALRSALAARWQQDNHAAIDAYNARIERDGLWMDQHRPW